MAIQDTGFVLPNLGENYSTDFIPEHWHLPENITTDDGSEASISEYLNPICDLWGYSFNFNIPSNAVITGVILRLKRRSDDSKWVRDYGLYLTYNDPHFDGPSFSSNIITSPGGWPVTATDIDYGSSTTTTFGDITVTPTIANMGYFGIAVHPDFTAGGHTAYVDYVKIKIFYETYSQIRGISTFTGIQTLTM